MKVVVCIGSSCHLKGSHEVVRLFKEYIERHHLEDKITLNGTFCLGKCSDEGVSVQIDDGEIYGVTANNFEEFAMTHLSNL